MKKLFTTLLAVAAMSSSLMAESVSLPYKSDMFTDVSQMDEGWTKANSGNRRALVWEYDRDNTGSALATPGTKSAACHNFDPDYEANCWMFSPEVTLKAGGNYTIGLWAKSKGSDAENFKICYGSEASVAAMTSTILDCPDFENPDDYVFKSAKLVPTENMTVRFGINCYSPANRNVLSVTGFTVSDENGNTDVTVHPVQPSEAAELPFTYDFTSSADFAKNWTTGRGEDSEVPGDWTVSEYSKWVILDDYNNKEKKENNWLISQPLSFTEAGAYALKYTGLLNGKLEFLIGTTAENLDGYTSLGFKEDASFSNDEEYTLPFSVETPGEYRIAVRACADAHTSMGYRMKSLNVRSDKPVPALVSDLTAMASPMDELEVNLTWTNPAVDHLGNTLADITKLELYRNGTMIKDDFSNLTPNAFNAWVDRPEAAGIYSYHVVVYNANGCSDGTPMEVSAGFVGRPTAELPYSANSSEPADMTPFTFVDGNNDGTTWKFIEGTSWWYNETSVKLPDGGTFDDYLISPYLHLTPGYYVFDYTVGCRFNSFEAGYVTDRHNPAETFVKLNEFLNWEEYSAPKGHTVFVVETEGDYALCIHAVGEVTNSSYYTVDMSSMSLEATQPLPVGIKEVTASDTPAAEGFDVTLAWTNPDVDNAGKPLGEDAGLVITVKRGEETIATLSGAEFGPGMECSYTDKGVAEGEYTYFVQVGNANGTSEDRPVEVNLYVGPLLELPYSTENFSEWKTDEDAFYPWTVNETTGFASWEAMYGFSSYGIFSPYLSLDPDKQYEVQATFTGNASQGVAFISSAKIANEAITKHHSFTIPEADKDHVFSAIVTAADAAPEALADETQDNNEDARPQIAVPTGKILLGFCNDGGGKITLKAFSIKEHVTLGIDAVETEAAEAPAEYYNLQGIRVDNPRSGIYILRQGNKATKVIL